MQSKLRTFYIRILLPALVASAALLAARELDFFRPFALDSGRVVAQWVFIVAIVLAVAAPILLRTLFAHRMRFAKSTPSTEFFRLQKWLIGVTLLTTYLVPITCLLVVTRFYHAGVLLAAFYAGYYGYPSMQRIAFDQRIFRVDHGIDPREIQSQGR